MKIWIEKAKPILTRVVKPNYYGYAVKHWEVEGAYIVDEEACECGADRFALYVDHKTLNVSTAQLKKLVEIKLTKS